MSCECKNNCACENNLDNEDETEQDFRSSKQIIEEKY